MKKLGVKSSIFTLVVLISLIFAMISSIFFNFRSSRTERGVVEAADLTIETFEGFKSFIKSVNGGNNFSGKTVLLAKDINCDGYTFYPIGTNEENLYTSKDAVVPFAGTFDGGGHTIRNFDIEDAFAHYYGGGAGELYGCGFFAALDKGASVINLRLYNYQIYSTHTAYSPTSMAYSGSSIGGIAGFLGMDGSGKARIENCIIENCYIFYESEFEIVVAVGGILGGNPHVGAVITNCLIIDLTIVGQSAFAIENVGGIVGNDPSSGDSIVSVSDCVVNTDNWYYATLTPSSGCTVNYFTSQTATDCHSSANSTSGLGCSSEGGRSIANTPWYHYTGYNDGWPMLRLFMDWTKIGVRSYDESLGTVSKSFVEIPTDLMSGFAYNPKQNPLNIYSQTVEAKPTSGYEFSKWAMIIENDGYVFIAYFSRRGYYFTFNNIGSFSPQCSTFETGTTIKVYAGDSVEVKCEHSKDYTTITIQIGSNLVVYQITETKYTVNSYGTVWYQPSGQGMSSFEIKNLSSYYNSLTLGSTYTITPTVKLKTYTVLLPT